MSLSLHTIKPKKGARKNRKRIGRGLGSTGTYSGRGLKGQKARAGSSGLQLKGIRDLMLSQPKVRGFKSKRPKPEVVNVGILSKHFSDGDVVKPKSLQSKGLIEGKPGGVKILGNGSIGIKVTLKGCKVSQSAKAKIVEAGGSVQ